MADKHRPRRMTENADGDFVAVCACGWKTDPKPVEEIAKSVLAEHIAEAEAATASPEAEAILGKLEKALSRPAAGQVRLDLTAAEARFLRNLVSG